MKPEGPALEVAINTADEMLSEDWNEGDPLPSHHSAGSGSRMHPADPCPACGGSGNCPDGKCENGMTRKDGKLRKHQKQTNKDLHCQGCTVYGYCLACMGDGKASYNFAYERTWVRLSARLYGHDSGPELTIRWTELLTLVADRRNGGGGEQLALT